MTSYFELFTRYAVDTSIPLTESCVIYGLYCTCDRCVDTQIIRYTGLTTGPARVRLWTHRKRAKSRKTPLPSADWIKSHGTKNIQMVVLEVCESPEDLSSQEIHWISELDTYLPDSGVGGLNMTRGGDLHLDRVYTPEQRRRMSEAQIKHWEDHPERREEHSRLMKEVANAPAARESQVNHAKTMWERPEHRENIAEKMTALWTTDEHREKVRVAKEDPDVIERQYSGLRRIQNDPKHKEMMRSVHQKTLHARFHLSREVLRPAICTFCVDLQLAGSDWPVVVKSSDTPKEKDLSRDGSLGSHTRWHVNRGVVKEGCALCAQPSSGLGAS